MLKFVLKFLGGCCLLAILGLLARDVVHMYARRCADRTFVKYRVCMLEGNGEQALKYAKRCANFRKIAYSDSASDCVACAMELTGDYDGALSLYRQCLSKDEYPLCELRVMVKTNRRAEAFDGYCRLIDKALETATTNSRYGVGERLARGVTMADDYNMRLSAFPDYASFLSFMETEFKAQGEPAEKVPAMEFLRSLTDYAADPLFICSRYTLEFLRSLPAEKQARLPSSARELMRAYERSLAAGDDDGKIAM